ncbi:MAG: hypothetical protein QNL91_07780 [Candidatus Krumholzibacteria bacterium]|nr:hypothetical protein [Candidatus Krumholzibacteria bacterium]
MRSQRNLKFGQWVGLLVLLGLIIGAVPSQAQAGAFTRLQVLLPGESAAPGTATGKSGAPDAQTVGVPFLVVVRACDDDWTTVATVSDAVSWNSTDESAGLPGTVQLTTGQATATVVLNAAGTFTISGQDLSDPTIAEAFSANVVAVVLAGFQFAEINNKHQTAGIPMSTVITAVDPNGNTVAGYSGPVNLQQFTSFGLGRISPETVTLDGGTWTGQVIMYRADETNINRGNVNLYAFLSGDTSINGASNPFLVHPGGLKRAQIVLPGQVPAPGSVTGLTGNPASQGATQPFTVDLYSTDDFWNPLSTNDVLRIVSSDAGASTPVTVTLVGGVAQASLHLGTVGAQTLTVNDLSNGAVKAMTSAPVMVIPSFAHHFEFDDLPETIVAGTELLVTIRATDAGGNTISTFDGDAILSANTGPGSISPESISFNNGVWLGVMEFFGAGGAVQVTCADYSTPPHQGTSNATHVLPGPYVATQVILPGQIARGGTQDGLEGTPDNQDAGQSFELQIRAVDQYFNRVTGINNPVVINSSDPNLTVPANASLTNGEAFIPVTIFMSGNQTVSVSDAVSQGIATPMSSSFYVAPGPYANLLLIAPGEEAQPGAEDGRVGSPTDQSITYLFTVIVLATDQWFNQVHGVGDVTHLTSTDPGAELPNDTAMEDGKAFLGVRLATGGFQQLTVASVSNPAITTSVTQVRAISSGLHLEANIAETAVQAGVPFTLSVDMVNDAGSIIQEINSEVSVTVRNANTQDAGRGALSATSFQLLQGQRSITLTYTFAEPVILEISDEAGSTPALTEALNVQPGAPSVLELTSSPGWVPANRSALISAAITDAFGNAVPNQSVTFATSASDSGSLEETVNKADDKSVVSLTDEFGIARVNYLSPRHAQVAQVTASSGQLSAQYDLETALVDPNAAGGHITNYPNPFHPDETATTIAYVLDDNATVRVRVYTLSGSLVLDRQHASGDVGGSTGLNEITWDGRNGTGEPVASGGYIVYVEAEGNGATQHVMRRKIGVVW